MHEVTPITRKNELKCPPGGQVAQNPNEQSGEAIKLKEQWQLQLFSSSRQKILGLW